MIRVAVCDDEIDEQERLRERISSIFKEKSNDEFSISCFTSGWDLLEKAEKENFDVVFLDIDMPDIDGLNVANRLTSLYTEVNLVFVSNRVDLVFESIHQNPFRFVRKSHFEEEIKEAILSLLKKLTNDSHVASFENKTEQYHLPIHEIVYIESRKHYVYINTYDKEYKIRMKLSSCEEMLKGYGFIRIHGSILVNVRKIKCLNSKEAVLINGKALPISRNNIGKCKMLYLEEMERFANGSAI